MKVRLFVFNVYLVFVIFLLSQNIVAYNQATSLQYPLSAAWQPTQEFGVWNEDWLGYHLADDIVRTSEVAVYAIGEGEIKFSDFVAGYGYVVIIEHERLDGSKFCSLYGHMKQNRKISGMVTKGETIGYLSGDYYENGGYNFIHLHFGIRLNGYVSGTLYYIYNTQTSTWAWKWAYMGYTKNANLTQSTNTSPYDVTHLEMRTAWTDPSDFIDNYTGNLTGYYSDGWHSILSYPNNSSQPFVDAYNNYGGHDMFGDPWDNGSTAYAHSWPTNGDPSSQNVCILQDFLNGSTWWQLVLNASKQQAFALHGQILTFWSNNYGYQNYGPPMGNEFQLPYSGGSYGNDNDQMVVQKFCKNVTGDYRKTIVYNTEPPGTLGHFPVGVWHIDGESGYFAYENVNDNHIPWPNASDNELPTGEWIIDAGVHHFIIKNSQGVIIPNGTVTVEIWEGNTQYFIPGMVYPPQNLAISSVTTSSVTMSWQDANNTDATYTVYRTHNSTTSEYASELTSLSYTDNSVTQGETYEYYVKAVVDDEESYSSNTVSTTIPTGTSSPNLQLSTNHLKFDSTQTAKTFDGYNIGGGTLEWDMQVPEELEWFSVSPLGEGTGNFTATVTVGRDELLLGGHSEYIDIPCNGGYRTVRVDVTKVASGNPGILLSSYLLDYSINEDELTVTVYNSDSGTLSWSASENESWISSISPSSGTLGQNEGDVVTVTIDRLSLPVGGNTGYVFFSSNAWNDTLALSASKEDVPDGYVIAFEDGYERTSVGPNYDTQLIPDNLASGILIENGRLRMYNNNGGGQAEAYINTAATQSENMVITLDIDNGPSESSNQSTAIYIRKVDDNNYYSLGIKENSYYPKKVQIAKTANGSSSILYLIPGATLEPGRYRFSAIDDTISFTNITGTEINITVVDSDVSGAGCTGFYTGEEDSYFDNVIVYTPIQPNLVVSVDTLDFGTEDSLLTFQIENDATGVLNWTASSTDSWTVSVSPSSGSLVSGDTVLVEVLVDRDSLADGNYTGSVNIGSNAGNDTVATLITKYTAPSSSQTATFYAEAGDGHIYMKEYGLWDTIHDAASSNDVDETYVWGAISEQTDFYNDRAGQSAPYEYEISRAFFPFNTSSLPNNAQILSANLIVSIKHQTHNQVVSLGVVEASQASMASLVDTDFGNCGAVDNPEEGSNRIEFSAVETEYVRRSFALNTAGLSWINKDGYTNLGIRASLDLDDQEPSAPNRWSLKYSEYTGTDDDPVLEVEYIVGDPAALSLSVDTLDFGIQTQKTFNVNSNVSWSISTSQSWLSVDISSGSGDTLITAIVDTSVLSNGTYNATINISGGGLSDSMYVSVSKQTLTTSTVTFYAAMSGDIGYSVWVSWPWSQIHDASSAPNAYTNDTWNYAPFVGRDNEGKYTIKRAFYVFNTATIPDNAAVTAAKLYVFHKEYCNNGDDIVGVVSNNQASNTTLVGEDFDQLGDSLISSTISTFNFALSSYNGFELTSAGLSEINKTGYTKLGLRVGHDFNDQAPTTKVDYGPNLFFTGYTGTSQDPYLEVTYAVALAKPIAEGEDDKEEAVLIPKQFKLCQNYPNPFNPETVIKYELPKDVHVYISVYNILGQQVAVLEDSYHEAGYYQVTWKSDNLSSGLYFYQINAGKYMEIKKMLLIK